MGQSVDLPVERTILRSFVLPDEQGRMVDLESFRQQRNLVLLLLKQPDPPAESLLRELAEAAGQLAEEEGVVLPVLRANREEAAQLRERLRLPFPVLADEQGEVIGSLCADGASLYITDRFREIFAARHGAPLFSRDEVLEWLAHINRQCPE